MKERVELVLEWERRWKRQQGQVNVAELCRIHGVSRECGHKWIRRYQDAGYDLRRSRSVRDDRVRVRRGSVTRYRTSLWRRASFIRAGVTAEAPCVAGRSQPGHRGAESERPQVLPADDHGCLQPIPSSLGGPRRSQRDRGGASLRFRLPGVRPPEAIRSDNGPPFVSTGAGGLSRLSVWWLRLGIRVERIEPGKPQQNGRHERRHLTLKLETEVQASLAAQQREFDLWRREFNEERPHEALGQKPPAPVYQTSSRRYPRKLVRPEPEPCAELSRVDKSGFITWRRRNIFIRSALAHELVELDAD
jgi:Integrase core domain